MTKFVEHIFVKLAQIINTVFASILQLRLDNFVEFKLKHSVLSIFGISISNIPTQYFNRLHGLFTIYVQVKKVHAGVLL